jgi:hypothetical protein
MIDLKVFSKHRSVIMPVIESAKEFPVVVSPPGKMFIKVNLIAPRDAKRKTETPHPRESARRVSSLRCSVALISPATALSEDFVETDTTETWKLEINPTPAGSNKRGPTFVTLMGCEQRGDKMVGHDDVAIQEDEVIAPRFMDTVVARAGEPKAAVTLPDVANIDSRVTTAPSVQHRKQIRS